MSLPDNYDFFKMHEDEMDEKLEDRPVCVCCEEHVQNGHCYNVFGAIYCPDCMEAEFRVNID